MILHREGIDPEDFAMEVRENYRRTDSVNVAVVGGDCFLPEGSMRPGDWPAGSGAVVAARALWLE